MCGAGIVPSVQSHYTLFLRTGDRCVPVSRISTLVLADPLGRLSGLGAIIGYVKMAEGWGR
jgi:hypothetical protein